MKRVLSSILWAVGLVGLVLGVSHVLIRPLNPAQERPEQHVPGPCWLCHVVASSAQLVEE